MMREFGETSAQAAKRERETEFLRDLARLSRKKIMNMAIKAGGGHIGPAFSCLDIIITLYYEIMKTDHCYPKWGNRDRFILSKGQGCLAHYVTLAQRGFFGPELLDTFCQPGTILSGHDDIRIPGVEASTGSLGQGLSMALGMALAGKIDKKDWRVFALLGDGECEEGSIWEAAMAASHLKTDNLIAIVDHNGIQAIGSTDEIMSSLKPLGEKFKSFGWAVKEENGHDFAKLAETLKTAPFEKNKPSVLIARTVKGKGVSFMENTSMWHYKVPNEEEYKQAIEELYNEEEYKQAVKELHEEKI